MSEGLKNIITGLFVLIVVGIFYSQAGDLEGVSLLYPQILLIFLTVGSVLLCINGILKLRKGEQPQEDEPVAVKRVALIAVASCVYVAVVPFLGFYPTSAIFLFCMAMLLNDATQSTRKMALTAGLFTVVLCSSVWLGFSFLLNVPTPGFMDF